MTNIIENAIRNAINENNLKLFSDLNENEIFTVFEKNKELKFEMIEQFKQFELDGYISDILRVFDKNGAILDYNINDYGYNYIKAGRDSLENYFNIISALNEIRKDFCLFNVDILDLYDVVCDYYSNYGYWEHDIVYTILTGKIEKYLNELLNVFTEALNYYDDINNLVEYIKAIDYDFIDVYFDNNLTAYSVTISKYNFNK